MATKLFVGNLSHDTIENDLQDYFAAVGQVVAVDIVHDRVTGKSRGFGFVEMASEEEARRAIEELNGKQFQGRPLTINEARPREERPRSFSGGGGGYRGAGGGGGGGGDRGYRGRR